MNWFIEVAKSFRNLRWVRDWKLGSTWKHLSDVSRTIIDIVNAQHICEEKPMEIAVEDFRQLDPVRDFLVPVSLVFRVPP